MEINAAETYSFAASSTDKDGDDIQYTFYFGDGSSESSEFLSLPAGSAFNALHEWLEPGDYTLKVTVTDGQLSSSSEIIIKVNPAPISAELLYGGLLLLFALIFIIIFLVLRRQHPKPSDN